MTWMNEEWYNDKIKSSLDPDWVRSFLNDTIILLSVILKYSNYPLWVQKLVSAYEPMIDAKDRTFARFLLDIPFVPQEVLHMLRDLCVEPDRLVICFFVYSPYDFNGLMQQYASGVHHSTRICHATRTTTGRCDEDPS